MFREVLDLFNEHEDIREVLPLVLNSIIDDILFEKYKYEEEDKIRFLSNHLNKKFF